MLDIVWNVFEVSNDDRACCGVPCVAKPASGNPYGIETGCFWKISASDDMPEVWEGDGESFFANSSCCVTQRNGCILPDGRNIVVQVTDPQRPQVSQKWPAGFWEGPHSPATCPACCTSHLHRGLGPSCTSIASMRFLADHGFRSQLNIWLLTPGLLLINRFDAAW